MEKTYNPKDFEKKIYDEWLEKKAFKADNKSKKKPFTIVMPPPNITGQLHMGHGLNNTIQDAIIRYKRMKGFETLWVPGTDHASIATEVVIIKALKEEGLDKLSLGREGFLKRAWEWNERFGGRIVEQIKRLGCSCDWERLAFTMDEKRARSVLEVFVKLYEQGYIYRGDRIINWCPKCKTALSDAEVKYVEAQGSIWHIKYNLIDSNEFIVVATTRPETMLGDTAVAVNPNDKRYKHLIGKTLELPLMKRQIPIIADEYVDETFGTGAVKITPAHDPNDFVVGERHKLSMIRVMNDDGTINQNGGNYKGLDRLTAREKILSDLKDEGRLLDIKKHTNNKGHCDRCKETVEPLFSKQWFVRMDDFAKEGIKAVESGEVRFVPKRLEKVYFNWLRNIKDWCISRQLWWGHRIPAYYCTVCGHMHICLDMPKLCTKCGALDLKQDEDVLDTWFSSALWPFSTLGWPDCTEDLKKFYPTNVLVTAQDIIFFWVARMIFSGVHFMNGVPFDTVVFNGIVRDMKGKKMSKSDGNGVDPLELIDEYGADALRFSILFNSANGSDIRFDRTKIVDDRSFIAKLWNASRFCLMNIDCLESESVSTKLRTDALSAKNLSAQDMWVISKFNQTIKTVTRLMDKYETGLASARLYEFIWNDFCDWYIETVKPILFGEDQEKKKRTVYLLTDMLSKILRAVHPFIPFVSEEIYKSIPEMFKSKDAKGLIMLESYPEPYNVKSVKGCKTLNDGKKATEAIFNIIKRIRELRVRLNISQSKRTKLMILPMSEAFNSEISDALPYILRLGMGLDAEILSKRPEGEFNTIICPEAEIFIPLDSEERQKERERLLKDLKTAVSELERAVNKLGNQGFLSKAPKPLIDEEKAKAEKYKALVEQIKSALNDIS